MKTSIAFLFLIALSFSWTPVSAQTTPEKKYRQVDLADGWEFWDEQGLAFKMNKNQVVTYNRELQNAQRKMNAALPPRASIVPETGRYNYPMLEYGYWALADQAKQLAQARRAHRINLMAEALGKIIKNNAVYNEPAFEAALENEAKNKKVFGIVEAKTKPLTDALKTADAAIQAHKDAVAKFKDAAVISEADIPALQKTERNALRCATLAFLESQKITLASQAEGLGSEMMRKAISQSAGSAETKGNLKSQAQRLRQRAQRLSGDLDRITERLLRQDYEQNSDSIQAEINKSQIEISVYSSDTNRFHEAVSNSTRR